MKTISDMEKNYKKKDFIVENLMKSNGLYCLVARPKVGKSLFGLQIANSIATGTTFLGLKTNPSPVLYISTEMDFMQLYSRIKMMNLQFNDKNFSYIEQEPDKRKLNMMDLKLEFQTFAYEKNGKFIVVDMFSGIDLNNGYNLNDYQDMGQYVLPQFREICKKYGFTILLIHHLNKNNSSLGSTAIDGSVDGIFTLKKDNNLKNKLYLHYESRDFESRDWVLKRTEHLILEESKCESDDLNINLVTFLNYAIRQKEFSFTASDITSKLNMQITPSAFGKLLNSNIENLEKEGLHLEQKRTATERIYTAKYAEPIDEN